MPRETSDLMVAWREAITFEQSTRDRYLNLAQLAQDPSIKALFEYLAEEELKHRHLLEDQYNKSFAPEN